MTVTRRIARHLLRGCRCRAAKQRGNNECCRMLHSARFISLCNCDVESKRGRISRIMKTPIHPLEPSINLPPLGFAFHLIVLALVCFALLPEVQGQNSPPPDGCIPNFTTAAGCN